MQINEMMRTSSRATGKRIGRGGKRGKTSGRGHKGQRQHGDHGVRPEIRDVIKKLPKLRGYNFNSFRPDAVPINLDVIEANFAAGETVNRETLADKGLVTRRKAKKCGVKILSRGSISKKLTFTNVKVSTSAKEAISKAGGTIE
jgi:large subunit ribosomal protein L15